jgi:hypothetical protein
MAADMADELPGFIPQVLRLDDVSLLRADETVLNAMFDGWRAQMLARGLAGDTIKGQSFAIASPRPSKRGKRTAQKGGRTARKRPPLCKALHLFNTHRYQLKLAKYIAAQSNSMP